MSGGASSRPLDHLRSASGNRYQSNRRQCHLRAVRCAVSCSGCFMVLAGLSAGSAATLGLLHDEEAPYKQRPAGSALWRLRGVIECER